MSKKPCNGPRPTTRSGERVSGPVPRGQAGLEDGLPLVRVDAPNPARDLTPNEVEKIVQSSPRKISRESVNSRDAVIEEVCDRYHTNMMQLRSQQRTVHIVCARHEIYYRLTDECGLTQGQIAGHFGFDRTTIRHGIIMHARRTGKPKLIGEGARYQRMSKRVSKRYEAIS